MQYRQYSLVDRRAAMIRVYDMTDGGDGRLDNFYDMWDVGVLQYDYDLSDADIDDLFENRELCIDYYGEPYSIVIEE
jgi:hypothetical protein